MVLPTSSRSVSGGPWHATIYCVELFDTSCLLYSIFIKKNVSCVEEVFAHVATRPVPLGGCSSQFAKLLE